MKRILAIWSAVVLSSGLAAGCATTRAIESAEASYQRARTAGAETKAPFEYYSAEAYLAQAKHEYEEGDRKQTKAYAQQSEFFSAKAIEMAGGGAK